MLNPVFPIIVKRSIRPALMAAAFQVGYRQVFRKSPPLLLTAAVNGLLTVSLCTQLITAFDGPNRFGYTGLFTKISTTKKQVALTFDDGPDPASTPRLLRMLDDLDIKATFFLLGEKARAYSELVDAIAGHGHAIALHGWTHRPLAAVSVRTCRRQIRKVREELGECALPYFRPPHGFKSKELVKACRMEDVLLTTWSINPKDYANPSGELLIKRVQNQLHPGAVILLHEWSDVTIEALPDLVKSIRQSGYDLTTLPGPRC